FGRAAYALVHYLTPTAAYEGFDVVDRMIHWCQQTITPRFPNFRFQKAEIRNPMYNPGTGTSAANFAFPYWGNRFDVALLYSVFTHMPAQEVRHYLDEINRVLKPGGRCVCTFFLLNPEARQLIEAGRSSLHITHPVGEYFTGNPELPEECIGFEEPFLLDWI